MILILVLEHLLFLIIKALILLILLLLLVLLLLLNLVLIVVDTHLCRHGMISLNRTILRECHAVLLARDSGRLLADRRRRGRHSANARIIVRTVTIDRHPLMHSIHQVLRTIRLALDRRVEARLGLTGRYTVHICLVGDRFKRRQLTTTTIRQRRSQMRSRLRLEVHVVDVLLLLEGGTHGRWLR